MEQLQNIESQAGEVVGAAPAIGPEQIAEFNRVLLKYKAGKASLERRMIDAEQWWKLRSERPAPHSDVQGRSAWLANVIMCKHADAMDAYPCCTCLPQEPADEPEAKKLSSILPAILRQNGFEKVYSDVWWHKLKFGTGCYKVIWDARKLGGLGDISICRVNLLNLFWEPGVEDIQDSEYVFHVELRGRERLAGEYPQWTGKQAAGGALTVNKFLYDDAVDVTDKVLVVDCYYKKHGVLHYCKYTGSEVLYATENEGAGLYDHGQYPFVLDAMFPIEGSCCGYGYIDYGKTTQAYIDKLTRAMMENALSAAAPRWFIRTDGGVNEAEYADFTNHFVHCSGNLGEDSIKQIKPNPLAGVYLNVLNTRVTELKETLGNRDAAVGGVTASVTSASGIASLQEAAGKLSRDAEKASYRVFEQVIYLCIELIRQFYDVARSFRITGELGEQQFVRYDNAGIAPRAQGTFGQDMGVRVPQFDIDVQAQKENPYTKESYNELALQLYSMGVLNPQNAQMALMVLEMMDFKGKHKLQQRLTQYAQQAQMQQMMQMQAMMAAAGAGQSSGEKKGTPHEPSEAGRVGRGGATERSGRSPSGGRSGAKFATTTYTPKKKRSAADHPFAVRAREQSRASTQPR